MAVHWVNYDLNKTGQDYTKLIDYLKSHISWAKPLKSSFFVKTSQTAAEVRDGCTQYIDANDDDDDVVVVTVTVTVTVWATYGLSPEVNEWQKTNL